MNRVVRWMVVFVVVGLAWGGVSSAQNAQKYKVVVNAGNSLDAATKAQVSDMFLKKTKIWSNGVEVEPIDLYPTSDLREAFSETVHGRSVAAVKSYWQRLIFSGEAVPPPEIENEKQVMFWVGSSPGAIGYVSASAPLGDGVKVLRVTD
jgi:ABC-type phosphate transport system substrate-binding protein